MISSITIGSDPKLTKLTGSVNYNPETNYPAVTVFNGEDNSYSVYGICYIPKGALIEKTLEEFNSGSYSGYTPAQSVEIIPGETSGKSKVVLAHFEDIKHASLVQSEGTDFTTRSFAVCYDLEAEDLDSYECDVYSVEFTYKVNDGSSFEVLFLTQGNLDPRLSRGTVTSPATPPPPPTMGNDKK